MPDDMKVLWTECFRRGRSRLMVCIYLFLLVYIYVGDDPLWHVLAIDGWLIMKEGLFVYGPRISTFITDFIWIWDECRGAHWIAGSGRTVCESCNIRNQSTNTNEVAKWLDMGLYLVVLHRIDVPSITCINSTREITHIYICTTRAISKTIYIYAPWGL